MGDVPSFLSQVTRFAKSGVRNGATEKPPIYGDVSLASQWTVEKNHSTDLLISWKRVDKLKVSVRLSLIEFVFLDRFSWFSVLG